MQKPVDWAMGRWGNSHLTAAISSKGMSQCQQLSSGGRNGHTGCWGRRIQLWGMEGCTAAFIGNLRSSQATIYWGLTLCQAHFLHLIFRTTCKVGIPGPLYRKGAVCARSHTASKRQRLDLKPDVPEDREEWPFTYCAQDSSVEPSHPASHSAQLGITSCHDSPTPWEIPASWGPRKFWGFNTWTATKGLMSYQRNSVVF